LCFNVQIVHNRKLFKLLMSISNIIYICYFKLIYDTELIKFNEYKVLETYFQIELHTSKSQDCFVQVSQRLISKKLHIEDQFEVEEQEAKREIHHTIH